MCRQSISAEPSTIDGETAMNATKLSFVSLTIALASGLFLAQNVHAQNDVDAALVSRAQVLAELHIWRQSGLADVQSGESASDPTRNEYIAALARYHGMRSSPEFTQLVARIERQRAESRQVAKQ
jgi:hypothetical protein